MGDNELLQAIKEVIKNEVKDIRDDVNNIKDDIKDIKAELKDVKDDVKDIKAELNNVKNDVKNIKVDLKDVKDDVKNVKVELKDVKDDVKNVKTEVIKTNIRIESEIIPGILLLKEGHQILVERVWHTPDDIEKIKEAVSILDFVQKGMAQSIKK